MHKFIAVLPCWERNSGPNPVDPSQPDLVVHTVGDQLKSCNDQKGGIDTSAKHLWRHVTACNRPWRSRWRSRTLHICISQVQLWKPCILMTSSHILSNCHIQVDWKGIQWIQMNQNQLQRNYRTTDTLLIIKKFHELFLVKLTFTLPPNCNHLRFFNHSTHPIRYPQSQWTVCFLGNNPGIHGVTADPGRRRRCTKGSAAEKDISSPCRGGRSPFIHSDIISRDWRVFAGIRRVDAWILAIFWPKNLKLSISPWKNLKACSIPKAHIWWSAGWHPINKLFN